jgi:hypothetical protein
LSQNSALEVYKQYTKTANQNHAITTTKKLFTVLCDVMQNNPVNTHQHFKEPTAFILRVEDRDSRLLCNVGIHIQDHMAPGVQRQQSLCSCHYGKIKSHKEQPCIQANLFLYKTYTGDNTTIHTSNVIIWHTLTNYLETTLTAKKREIFIISKSSDTVKITQVYRKCR